MPSSDWSWANFNTPGSPQPNPNTWMSWEPSTGPTAGPPAGDATGAGFNWGSVVGPAVGLAGALMTPSAGNITKNAGDITAAAKTMGATGASLVNAGAGGLDAVMKYFQGLVSGDANAVLAATQPERARVIDQYDAAKRSIGQFTPRGGGQASSMMTANVKEASDLATTTSKARSDAASSLGQIGAGLTQAGLTAEEASIQQMSQVLGPLLAQQQQSEQSTRSTWEAIGSIVGEIALYSTVASSRELKERIHELDPEEVHQALLKLKISRWSYKDNPEISHLGPMAEDFQKAFGVGDGKTIHLVDVIGVLLASQKALASRVEGR